MGHSQGGLASRWAAQYLQTNYPLNTSGVITIDSPNNGADFATNGFLAMGFLTGWGVTSFATDGCVSQFDNMGCYIASAEIVAGAGLLTDFTASKQSVPDMLPFSGFLSNLNSFPETFNRAGVIGYTPQRWAFTRVLTEKLAGLAWGNQLGPEPCNPEDLCGERVVALATDAFYWAVVAALIIAFIVSWFFGISAALIPYLIAILFCMDVADAAYNVFMDFPGDGSSDGIVDGPGQLYLGANPGAVQYPINGADSHSAALRSTYDRHVLDTILAGQFRVPTQASCTFGTVAASSTPSALAGTGSIALSAAAGCQWSASSSAPWLAITSGVNGNSSSTINYSVQANPSTVPRQGSIQVGNGFSSTMFTVLQAGVCTYTFSPGPAVASPPGGETSGIQVFTQTNCPWSVETATSWLSITSGTSGMGSGTFAFAALPNTVAADRSGTITLMGQTLGATLSIIDGSPVGTPGSGAVTLTGAPRNVSYNPCPTNLHINCPPPILLQEIGTVSVIVGGDTFTVSYPLAGYLTSTTSALLASALASQINNRALPVVTATVSGSTITITSTINGLATDFPLATSFSFNQECNLSGTSGCLFSSPAFSAGPTGSQLTGGTN